MKRNVILVLVIFLFVTKGLAQINKFGKVSDADWAYEKCAFDSTAKAVVLMDIGEVTFKKNYIVKNTDKACKLSNEFFLTNFERHTRIKVLSSIPVIEYVINARSTGLYSDKLRSFNAYVFSQENGKVSKTKITQKQLEKVKNEDGSIDYKLIIHLPKPGEIVDIYYLLESNIFTEFPSWDFSNQFPTVYSEANYLLPDMYDFNKECFVKDKLTYESHTQYDAFRVTVSFQRYELDYDISEYTAHIVKEKYTLKNIKSFNDLSNSYKLRYLVKYSKYGSLSARTGRTQIKGEFSNN